MFLFGELPVEQYVSQMTTLTIIATVLGVIGVGLLIFAFILRDKKAQQAAAADTAEQSDSAEKELFTEEEQPAEDFFDEEHCEQETRAQEKLFAEPHYAQEPQPQQESVVETTSEEIEEEKEEKPIESPVEEDTEEEIEEDIEEEQMESSVDEDLEELEEESIESSVEKDLEELSPVEEPQSVEEVNDDSAPFVFGNSKGKRIPFKTKVADGNDMTKLAYKTISEFLLSQPKVKCAKAFACERYYIGRKSIAKLTVRGKTLNCYLAINPTTLDAKYHAHDASDSKKYEKTPAMIKARSPRAIKYCCTLAKQIIEEK